MHVVVEYVLPFLYIGFIAWLLQRNGFLRNNELSPRFIAGFFIAKCVAGCLFTYVSIHYIPKADLELFYNDEIMFKGLLGTCMAIVFPALETFHIIIQILGGIGGLVLVAISIYQKLKEK